MQCKAKQRNATQSKATQSKAKQSNAKRNEAKQNNAKRSKAKQSNAKRNKAIQHETGCEDKGAPRPQDETSPTRVRLFTNVKIETPPRLDHYVGE